MGGARQTIRRWRILLPSNITRWSPNVQAQLFSQLQNLLLQILQPYLLFDRPLTILKRLRSTEPLVCGVLL